MSFSLCAHSAHLRVSVPALLQLTLLTFLCFLHPTASLQLEMLCFCIVEHIQSTVSPAVEVEGMVLNFIIDVQDRVWLLWCEQVLIHDAQSQKMYCAMLLAVSLLCD